MSAPRLHLAWVFVALILAACETDSPAKEPNDPPPPTDACQSSPGELPRPPSGTLPCELFPPGFEGAGTK